MLDESMVHHPLLSDPRALRSIFAEAMAFSEGVRTAMDLRGKGADAMSFLREYAQVMRDARNTSEMIYHMAAAFELNRKIDADDQVKHHFDLGDLAFTDPAPSFDPMPLQVALNMTERLANKAASILGDLRLCDIYESAITAAASRHVIRQDERRTLFLALKTPKLAALAPEK